MEAPYSGGRAQGKQEDRREERGSTKPAHCIRTQPVQLIIIFQSYSLSTKKSGNGKLEIFTTAPIFLLSNYFRQKYLEIASCAVSLLNNIWVQVEHSLLQKLKSFAVEAVYRQDVNKM